jgi:deazaflavin-dependent oxidoreductase (nitroreductase family)
MPLRHVDPHTKHSMWYRAMVRFGRNRLSQFIARRITSRIDPWLYRSTGGHVTTGMGTISTAPLTTTGAKSGQPREVQLAYFHDGSDPILIASNYGGPKHPQWYYNLKAHPECELVGEKLVAIEVTDSAEHTRLYALDEGVYAGYGDYRAKTARIGRQIPIFRLESRVP